MSLSNDIEDLEKFYNTRWKDFSYIARFKVLRSIALFEAIASIQLDSPRIIDLGCGTGWFSGMIGNFGPTVAVDLSGSAIFEASRRYPYVQFIRANFFNWDYPKGEFDIVISQEVIEHMPSLKDQENYLDIAYGLLRNNGYLILTTPNAETLYAMLDSQLHLWKSQPFENWLTISELRSLLNQQFNIIHLTTIIPGHGLRNSYRFFNSTRLMKAMDKIKLGKLFNFIRLSLGFGLHILAIAQKE
jgi:2-polyprenyl-3-methyl-5-hydroxy-6-metoxy-1,4-benzoquinol methylase